MIDHINIPVSDLATSLNMYRPVLVGMNMSVLLEELEVVGFGQNTWIVGLVEAIGEIQPIHIALSATSVNQVKQCYQRAIENGATDNGAPGIRPEYGANYYAAYVLDADQHNLEFVFRGE